MTGNADSSSCLPGLKTGIPARFGPAWLPAPILLLTILALWIADLPTPYESLTLLLLMNFVFTGLTSLSIAWLAGRGFLAGGQPGLLMLGCGVLFWGLATLGASQLANYGANTLVTIHNLGIFGAAFCHLAGLLWRGQLRRPGLWLGLGYSGGLVVVALLVWAAMAGWTPVFFVQGQGGTLLRQVVLVATIAMFGAASWVMLNRHRRQPSAFLYWYGLGLMLLAIGLLGVMLQSVPGSALSWSGRAAQFLGGAYMLIAALVSVRKTGEWRIELDPAGWDDLLLKLLTPHHLWPLHWGWRYGLAVLIAVAATVLRVTLLPGIGTVASYNVAILAIVVTTILLGIGPGLVCLLLADVAVEVFVVGSFATKPDGAVIARMIFSMAIGAFLIGILHSTRVASLKSQKSEARLNALYASMTEGLASHEVVYADGKPVDYILIDVNPAFERITGIPRERAVGARASILYGSGEPPYLDLYVRVAESGKPESFETDFASMGKSFHISASSPGKGRFTTVFSDITERKRAEQALRESEERFRLMGDSIPYGAWMADEEGRNIYISPLFLELVGMTLEQVKEFGWTDKMPPEDVEPTMRRWTECVRTGRDWEGELRFPSPDGRWHTILSRGKPVRDAQGQVKAWVGINLDITARKQAEKVQHESDVRLREVNVELRQSVAQEQAANIALREARRAAVNLMKDAVAAREQTEQAAAELQRKEADLSEAQKLSHIGSWHWDAKTDVTTGSEELLRIFGFDPATQTMPDFKEQRGRCYPEEDWECIDAAVQKTMETGVGYELDARVFRNNQTIWVTTRSEVVRDDDNRIVSLRGTVQDITERKQAEEALQALNEELEAKVERRTLELQKTQKEYMHLEKLSAIGKLSASIAHEFNNPLQGIMSVFIGLKDRAVMDEEDKILLDEAIEECNRMGALIRSLQDFNRPSSGIKTLFNVHNALDALILLHKSDFKKKRISVVLDYAVNLPQIEVVPDQIKQVFLNLLTNAADACHQSGEVITISTWQEDEERVAVSIKDTGVGIQPYNMESIFQPFFTTKPEVKGTGLGLSISYGIIENHQGQFRVESQPGEGATFTILLPIKAVDDSSLAVMVREQ